VEVTLLGEEKETTGRLTFVDMAGVEGYERGGWRWWWAIKIMMGRGNYNNNKWMDKKKVNM
jgi:hypothetical protein